MLDFFHQLVSPSRRNVSACACLFFAHTTTSGIQTLRKSGPGTQSILLDVVPKYKVERQGPHYNYSNEFFRKKKHGNQTREGQGQGTLFRAAKLSVCVFVFNETGN